VVGSPATDGLDGVRLALLGRRFERGLAAGEGEIGEPLEVRLADTNRVDMRWP
jgi:hypothetical protein